MNFGVQINKKDLITIVLLAVVFFSIAASESWRNPNSHELQLTLTAGQSFYVNLGDSTNVKYYDCSAGCWRISTSPYSWVHRATGQRQPTILRPIPIQQWSEDYYKWNEIPVGQTTQYLKVDVGPVRLMKRT